MSASAVKRVRSPTRTSYLPDLVEIEAERGRRSLRYFVGQAWHVLEPATDFVPNWHIDAICEHLEAVSAGEIRNLIINIPPGSMKSLTVSVFWPVQSWTRAPATRWLFGAYIDKLAIRDCVKSRRLIQSWWFEERWGSAFALTSDQNEKTRYENDQTGLRVGASIHSATGERAHFVVADDPHNIIEGESEVKRAAVLTSWDEVWSQRLADPKRGGKVVLMQRVHQRDLSAHLLEEIGGYEHLCLPMEYEGKPCVTVLGRVDPREQEGELLWPARMGPPEVDRAKLELGLYGAAAQLQQRPSPRHGGLFKREKFELIDADQVPAKVTRARYWDKAGSKTETAKYTAGVLGGWDGTYFYIENVVRGRWLAPEREQQIENTAKLDGQQYGRHGVAIWVEQEPGSGGKESAENTVTRLAGYRIRAETVTGDKFTRADPLAGHVDRGFCKVVRAGWTAAFLDELAHAGPMAEYLDQMDAAAGAFNKLTLGHRQRTDVTPPALMRGE